MVTLKEAARVLFVRHGHTFRRAVVIQRHLGTIANAWRLRMHRLGFHSTLLRIRLSVENKFGQVRVRLRKFERPRLAGIVTTASLALKEIISWLEEVVGELG